MKKIFTLFCLIFMLSFSLFKTQIKTEVLKNYEQIATQYEKKGDLLSAINVYYYISKNDTLESNKKSLQKIEILLPKCREILLKELQGKWELKKKFNLDYYSNIRYTKFIEIKDNKIIFYNRPEEIVSEINLENNPFSYNDFGGFPSLKLDKEIWTFSTRKVNREKRLRLRKHIDKNGNLIVLSDHRGVIIDDTEREIALKQEIDTYYVKSK